MKKNIIITAAFLVLCLYTLRAQESAKVSTIVTDQFSKHFASASNVRWEPQKNNVSMARFRYDNENWLAYYDKDAKLIASARFISSSGQLPVTVKAGLSSAQSRLQRKHGDLTHGKIFEVVSNGSTSYYIELQNDIIFTMVSIDTNGNASTRMTRPKAIPPQELKPFLAQKQKN